MLAASKQQRIDHEGYDIGLRNSLAFSNWQRRVFVGKFARTLRIASKTNSERTPRAAI
jgi:hypothetical protein